MKKLILSSILIFFASFITFAQEHNFTEEEIAIDIFTDRILTLPSHIENPPLVIFIQGSGLIKRDGNQISIQSDYAKKNVYELAEKLHPETIPVLTDFIKNLENK